MPHFYPMDTKGDQISFGKNNDSNSRGKGTCQKFCSPATIYEYIKIVVLPRQKILVAPPLPFASQHIYLKN